MNKCFAAAFAVLLLLAAEDKPKAAGGTDKLQGSWVIVGLITELRFRLPGLDPGYIDDLMLGVVTPVGDQGGEQGIALGRVFGVAVGGESGVHVEGGDSAGDNEEHARGGDRTLA